MNEIEKLIQHLNLKPLPEEGGYYAESFRSEARVSVVFEGAKATVERSAGTEIYYLVTPDDFSALHRVMGDEVFHFYMGDEVEMLQITEDGKAKKFVLGRKIFEGQTLQVHVPKNVWQGCRLKAGGKYALLGTSVFPGFEFFDFELGKREELIAKFPHLSADIINLTKV